MKKTVRFGSLTVGDIPRVVGTLSSIEAMKSFTALYAHQCDIAEVRLDLIGPDEDWLPLCREIEKTGTPVLLTLRSADEGGNWKGSSSETKAILESALPHVSAIDVELKSEATVDLHSAAAAKRKAVIVSYHNFHSTPAFEELRQIANDAGRCGNVAKLSTMVRNDQDLKTLSALLTQSWPFAICIIGMGSKAAQTRTDFPVRGSCLTYGYLDKPVAPGQLSATELVEHLRNAMPEYGADFALRHLPRKSR